MKHFYNVNSALTVTRPAANALGTALGSTMKLFTLVLLSFFLLVSGEGFGATFTTAQNNGSSNWNSPSTWGITAPTGGQPLVAGVHYPGANDDVTIANNYIVIVPSNFVANCKSLSMRFSVGNAEPNLIIDGSLTVATLTLTASNQSVRASMNLTVNGNLTVTTSATETGRLNFVCGPLSNVKYGPGVNVMIPRDGANNSFPAGTPQPFQNLIIDGNNVTDATPATLSSDVIVNGNLSLINNGKLAIGSNTATTPATPYMLILAEGAKIATTEDAANYITGQVQATRVISPNGIKNFGMMGASITNNSTGEATVTIVRTTGVSPITIGNNTSATRTYQVSGSPVLDFSADLLFLNHEITREISAYNLYNGASTTGLNLSTDATRNGNTFTKVRLDNGVYTIAGPPIPLPVELVSFKAQRHTQGVNLAWMTASEQDNSGFEVQVSTDSKTFEKIGFVKSEVGTSSIAQHYSFLDTKAMAGTRYYRLAQIDLDGTTTYSSIQAVALDGGNGQVAAYPNPFEDVVTVRLNGTESRKVKTILATAHGLIILQREVEVSGSTLTIDTSHVTAKGIYILHVMESDGTKHTIKLMKE